MCSYTETAHETDEFINGERRMIRYIEKENKVRMSKNKLILEKSVAEKTAAIRALLKDINVVDVDRHKSPHPGLIRIYAPMRIYCAVMLLGVDNPEVIHTEWIKNFDKAKLLNKGLDCSAKYMVFHSKDENTVPDFGSPLYVANILRFFGKLTIREKTHVIRTVRFRFPIEVMSFQNDYLYFRFQTQSNRRWILCTENERAHRPFNISREFMTKS